MSEFNLNGLFRTAFGYEMPKSFSLEKATPRQEFSSLGQPYYETDDYGREFFLPVRLNGLLIPFAVMSMNWVKKIVETEMPEREGTVNELISIGDYSFNIKGLLVDENGAFPEQGIIDLHNLFKINASISLRSALSDIVLSGEFEHKVIIREVKWTASAGVEHVKAFEISCKSDRIFDLELD